MANKNLNAAKVAKKDEFYTQLTDIENEIAIHDYKITNIYSVSKNIQ